MDKGGKLKLDGGGVVGIFISVKMVAVPDDISAAALRTSAPCVDANVKLPAWTESVVELLRSDDVGGFALVLGPPREVWSGIFAGSASDVEFDKLCGKKPRF